MFPKVSVSVLSYNHQDYIGRCLDAILAQEVDFEIEILIHDDASTDETVSIIKKYVTKFPHIIKPIFQDENQYKLGKQLSLNNFQRAQGKYIAICDGDDMWSDPCKLKRQVNFLDNNLDFVISFTDALMIDQNSDEIEKKNLVTCRNATAFELGTGFNIYTSSVMFRNQMQCFPPVLEACPIGDLAFWAYLSQFGKGKFSNDCAPIYYRMHSKSMFSSISEKNKTLDVGVTFLLIAKFHFQEGRFEMVKRAMFLSCFYVLKSMRFDFVKEFFKYLLSKGAR